MLHIIKQWIARALTLCVVGPVAAWLSHRVLAGDGSHQTTMLTGGSLMTGLGCLLGVAVLVALTGAIAGRMVDRREGLLNMAFVLVWVAWTSGRLGEVYRFNHTGATLVLLAIEGAVLTGAVLVAGAMLAGPGMHQGRPDEVTRLDPAALRRSLGGAPGLAAMGAGLIAGLLMAVIFGQSDLAGQSVGVGFGAGLLGGVAGAMAASSMKEKNAPHTPVPMAPIMLGVMLCSLVAPLIGIVRPGSGHLHALVIASDLPGYLIVSPSAWIMGALLGVPIGHSWVEHSAAQAGSGAPSRA